MPAGLFAFADLLHGANRRTGRSLFQTHFVALRAGTVECAHGVSVAVAETLDHTSVDAVLLPGFWAESARHVDDTIAANASLISALSLRPAKRQLWSYCSGVGLLAASGQLNGQAATVTWWLADAMAQRYKRVNWQIERTCIMNDRTATASGVNGYLPIAQALIERHVSAAVLRDLVKLMVLPRPAQTHGTFQAMSLIEQSSSLRRSLHALIEQLPADQIPVQRLAAQLHMSEPSQASRPNGSASWPSPIKGPILKMPLTRKAGCPSALTSPWANSMLRVVRSTSASPCTQAPNGAEPM